MTQIFNKATERNKRRILRNNMPLAEVILWTKLKGKQLQGYKFRRQCSIGRYVVDFYCPRQRLAIELDGESHYQNQDVWIYDRERQRFIESLGIRVIRFTNLEVYKNISGVLERIAEIINKPPLAPPS